MDILTSIPVRVNGPEGINPFLEEVRQRISRRAYENYIERGAVDGHDFDDWLSAERELTVRPAVLLRPEGADIFVEMILPELELPNLAVHVAPNQLVISSDPDEDGLQLHQVVDLPVEISLDGVDAEQQQNLLRITAALA